MQYYRITGGCPLYGTIQTETAKNSILPLLAASLLCETESTFRQVPKLTDVETSINLLKETGAEVKQRDRAVTIKPADVQNGEISPQWAGAMRSSVFYLAPLLVRAGRVRLPLPGGCKLGPRPIDIHLAGLAAMGAKAELDGEAVILRRDCALRGTDFMLRLPSVGATLTLMMAGCCAVGTTVLRGVACEPEISDMAAYLRKCGAEISGEGTSVLHICGGKPLFGTIYTPMPDRIVAATYAAATACAGGNVTVTGCVPEQLQPFLSFLRQTGCEIEQKTGKMTVVRESSKCLKGGLDVVAEAWPGFATDTAPLAAAILLTADAPSRINDTLFGNRFACAEGFAAMGAEAKVQGSSVWIQGNAHLHGAEVKAPDLRGGAALLLAALAAEGTTTVEDLGYIRRGYSNLEGNLKTLQKRKSVNFL